MRHIKLKSSLPGNRLPRPMPSKFPQSWQGVYSELPCVELRCALHHLSEFSREITVRSCFFNVFCASLLTSCDVMRLAKVSLLFNMFQYHKFRKCLTILKVLFATNIFRMRHMGVWLEMQQTFSFVPLMSAQVFCASSAVWEKGIPRHPQTPHGSNKASADTLKQNMLSLVSPRLCLCNLL